MDRFCESPIMKGAGTSRQAAVCHPPHTLPNLDPWRYESSEKHCQWVTSEASQLLWCSAEQGLTSSGGSLRLLAHLALLLPRGPCWASELPLWQPSFPSSVTSSDVTFLPSADSWNFCLHRDHRFPCVLATVVLPFPMVCPSMSGPGHS